MDKAQKKPRKQILVISLFVVLAAQINLDLLTSDFRVSFGILIFPLSIYLSDQIPVLPITFLSGLGVYVSRIILSVGNYDRFIDACRGHFPEVIFYFSYGILSYIYYRHIRFQFHKKSGFFFLCLLDYAANFFELLFRLRLEALDLKLQLSIIIVALIRTLLLWAIITELGHYRLVLLREEHAERYQRLILLISKLNEEVIWMKKNTTLIEDTMQRSYQLFSQIQAEHEGTELAQSALAVAKDIHEIKKEYMLILRGISENLDLNLQDNGMDFADLMMVLKNSLTALSAEKGIALQMETNCADSVFTDKHFFLLSIFRNILTNALEACETNECVISFTETSNETDYIFMLTDNGPGIPKENLEEIFVPGFSTKINFDTGEVNRGLGLNLVRDIIENQLNGTITVVSEPGNTVFTIYIPKKELEVV